MQDGCWEADIIILVFNSEVQKKVVEKIYDFAFKIKTSAHLIYTFFKIKISFMDKITSTNPDSWVLLIARLALGITILPHGAQKLLGMFGGDGFTGTMGFLTGMKHLPYIIALLVILIEFFGSLMLIFGAFTRVAALGFIVLFAGVVISSNFQNGFFMNWAGTQKGEGFEYFIMLAGLALVALIGGGGKASVDAAITKKLIGTK